MRKAATALVYAWIAVCLVALGYVHATFIGGYSLIGTSRFAWLLAYGLLLAVAIYASGIPDVPRNLATAGVSAVGAATASAVGMSLIQLVVGSQLLPRYVVFWGAVSTVPVGMAAAALSRGVWRRDQDRDRILLLAGPSEAAALAKDLQMAPEKPAVVVASGTAAEPLFDLVEEHRANLVVMDRARAADDRVVEQVARLHERGLRVRTLSLFYEEWLGKLPVSELERVSLMFDIGEVHRARYARGRRAFDVFAALLGVVPLVVLTPLVIAGNLIGNRGSLLHIQERIGRGGVPFRILKFRTMRPGSDSQAWATAHDSRVTPFGRLLRASHLDELPQVVNILRGHLSLVGPRPEQPAYVLKLRTQIPFYDLRHVVRPGLTGWAQVKFGYSGDEQGALEKLQYDFFYLRHQGVWLDLRTLFRTARSVLGS